MRHVQSTDIRVPPQELRDFRVIPPGQSAVSLEATAPDRFTLAPGVFFEFDAAKGTMTIKRPQGERVFTKEQ